MSAATIDQRMARERRKQPLKGRLHAKAGVAAQRPDPDPHPGPTATTRSRDSSRSAWVVTEGANA